MGRIRALVEEDLPRIVELYQIVHPERPDPTPHELGAFFEHVFFHSPWQDPNLPCLVYEEKPEKIIGFLGVFPRLMSFKGRVVKVAVSNNFMVDPRSRKTLAGLELLEKFFRGPQDLSLAEGKDVSRKIWDGLGGSTSLLYSFEWIRLLRPCRHIGSFLGKRGAVGRTVSLLSFLVDPLVARMPPNRFHRPAPGISEEELDTKTLLSALPEFVSKRLVRPVYDERSLTWLLDMFTRKKAYGTLHRVLLRDGEKNIVGWYLYYAAPGRTSQVLQVGASEDTINTVLDSLFRHAWRHGAVALFGGPDPTFLQQYSEKHCWFRHGPPWFLVHSRDPELTQSFHRGAAFFSRLEGEWMFSDQSLAPVVPASRETRRQ